MAFLNQCNFFGNVGRDAEQKQSKDRTKYWAEFSLGVSVGSSNHPKTIWIKCMCFGKLGERILERATKGASVYVSGKIDVGAYIGKKNNEAMVDISLMCNDVQIMKTPAKVEDLQFAPPLFDGDMPF
jgi:single-stranded DNA-binding protein